MRTRTSHGPRSSAVPAETGVPARASDRGSGGRTRAGSQLQLCTTWTRRPPGDVPVAAVTEAGRPDQPLTGVGASHRARARARARPGTVPT
ncbi:hypothetical protein GBF35_27460 [Nonomuraea phyllanthi]|uniref:hypothetical protein n=1 Tax=Nonomuraea phyllanthi TaxID=2219224 RepID=UPI00129366E4|nr:hypothetical protein [Nonomuraea phyllanthi]QFY09889.1 hypothetical protein GBF35_27460 [Nonomuraea phyllanthi]